VDVPARVYTAVKTESGLPDIKRFDVPAINEFIDRQFSVLKPEETVAGIALVDLTGGKLAVVGRVPDVIPGEAKWTIYALKEWSGDWNAGAAVRWSM